MPMAVAPKMKADSRRASSNVLKRKNSSLLLAPDDGATSCRAAGDPSHAIGVSPRTLPRDHPDRVARPDDPRVEEVDLFGRCRGLRVRGGDPIRSLIPAARTVLRSLAQLCADVGQQLGLALQV